MRITLEIVLTPDAEATQEEIAHFIEFEMGWRGDLPMAIYDRAADSIQTGVAS